MRNLIINKTLISYHNYKGIEKVKDSNNNYTGEKKIVYSPKKEIKAHVSGARGSSSLEVFGTDISYDKTILLTKSEFKASGINENSVFFVDVKPTYKDGTPLYNYRVKRIAETINEVLIAIEKVSQNGNAR